MIFAVFASTLANFSDLIAPVLEVYSSTYVLFLKFISTRKNGQILLWKLYHKLSAVSCNFGRGRHGKMVKVAYENWCLGWCRRFFRQVFSFCFLRHLPKTLTSLRHFLIHLGRRMGWQILARRAVNMFPWRQIAHRYRFFDFLPSQCPTFLIQKNTKSVQILIFLTILLKLTKFTL